MVVGWTSLHSGVWDTSVYGVELGLFKQVQEFLRDRLRCRTASGIFMGWRALIDFYTIERNTTGRENNSIKRMALKNDWSQLRVTT